MEQRRLGRTGREGEIAGVVPSGVAMAQFALRWILDQPAVSTVIPGARSADQARANASGEEIGSLTQEQLDAVDATYDALVRGLVQDRW